MINKYYVRKLKKLLEKNTRYYNKERAGEPLPYIITDEKDYYKIMKLNFFKSLIVKSS